MRCLTSIHINTLGFISCKSSTTSCTGVRVVLVCTWVKLHQPQERGSILSNDVFLLLILQAPVVLMVSTSAWLEVGLVLVLAGDIGKSKLFWWGILKKVLFDLFCSKWRPGLSDVPLLSGISVLSFDSPFLYPLLFFYLSHLLFLPCPFSTCGLFSRLFFEKHFKRFTLGLRQAFLYGFCWAVACCHVTLVSASMNSYYCCCPFLFLILFFNLTSVYQMEWLTKRACPSHTCLFGNGKNWRDWLFNKLCLMFVQVCFILHLCWWFWQEKVYVIRWEVLKCA